MPTSFVLAALITLAAQEPAAPPPAPSPAEAAEIARGLAADAVPSQQVVPAPPPPSASSASLLPDISLIADFAAAWFSGAQDAPLQTGAHDPRHTGFNLQQLELSLSKSVDPYLRFDANIVFGPDEVEVEEAYATTLALPGRIQVRGGQFLTRLGRLNNTHPHSWDFVDQPLILGRFFGAEGNRGLGVEASWLMPLPWYVELLWSVTNADGAETARSFYGEPIVLKDAAPPSLKVASALDFQHTAALKQFFELGPDWSVAWGLSAAYGPNAFGDLAAPFHRTRTLITASDLYIKYRPVTRPSTTTVALQAEWFGRRRDNPFEVATDHAGYAYLLWRFARRFSTAARYEYGSAGDPLEIPLSEAMIAHPGVQGRATAAVTFHPSEFSRLRLQGSRSWSGPAHTPGWAAFLAFEVLIGAHGAHPF